MKIQNKNTRYFLYVRVSSEEQVKGDGLERQVRSAKTAVSNLGISLTETFVAAGVSAKEGKNRDAGGEFDRMIQSTKPGDVIYIEDNDRFGRDGYKGLVDLQNIVGKKKISFRILSTGVEVNEENFERMDILLPNFLKAVLAKEENDKKRKRIVEAIQNRKEKIAAGEVIRTNRDGGSIEDVPSWVDSAKWEVNGKAKILLSLFNLYLSGTGPATIARKFNLEKIQTLSGKGTWSQSVVYRLLSDRRTIGEKRNGGEWVKGYYPAAIPSDTFLRVQSKFQDNKGKFTTGSPKSQGNIRNLFSGVAFCRCGQPLRVTNGKAGKYADCWGKIKGLGCKDCSTKYEPMENSFCNLLKLHPVQLIREENSESANLQILKGRLAETQKQIENITAMVLKGLASDSLVKTQMTLEQQVKEIQNQMELESAKSVAVQGSEEKLKNILVRLDNLQTDNELRIIVQGWIRENVNRIDVNKVDKTFTIDLKTGNVVTMGFNGSVIGYKSTSLFTNSVFLQQQMVKTA